MATGLNSKMNELITLDFNQYWGLKSTSLTIAQIVAMGRFGAKVDRLPDWVQEKVRTAMLEKEGMNS